MSALLGRVVEDELARLDPEALAARERSRVKILSPAEGLALAGAPGRIRYLVNQGRRNPNLLGARNAYESLDASDPPSADLTAVTATTETGLWPVAQYTPVPAFDARAGKVYVVSAGGIVSTGASGTLIITPRWGTSTAGNSLGASGAQTVPINLSSVAWTLQFTLCFRQVGTAASTSTCVGTGYFVSAGTIATAGSAFAVSFGATVVTTADTTTAQGIFMGWTLSVAGSNTPRYAFIQSLN